MSSTDWQTVVMAFCGFFLVGLGVWRRIYRHYWDWLSIILGVIWLLPYPIFLLLKWIIEGKI